MLGKALLSASVSAPPAVYVEDVFSTFLYTGNGSTQTITNGINLAGKGGMIWQKNRSATEDHAIWSSGLLGYNSQDFGAYLSSNSTNIATQYYSFQTTSFPQVSSTGFTPGFLNANGVNYASWTFRKAAKFFDVVTYTGTGANRTIAHNLGSVPGAIWVKRTDTTGNWQCYHRSLANTQYLVLNSTAAVATEATRWNSTTPTSSVFSLGTDATVNASGGTYVAYVFAHDAGGFGTAGTDSVSACGTYTGNGSATGPTVTLNWEPQWVMIKRTDITGDWQLIDNMRGFLVGGNDAELNPNLSAAESTGTFVTPLATGFQLTTTDTGYNASGGTYIYIAIRRGPMRTPTSGTNVFGMQTYSDTSLGVANPIVLGSSLGFPVDTAITSQNGGTKLVGDRMRGQTELHTETTGIESNADIRSWAWQSGVQVTLNGSWYYSTSAAGSRTFTAYFFRRAPRFFDVVAYTGTGVARTVAHNLGAIPELILVKGRSGGSAWQVYSSALANTEYLVLNTAAAKTTGATRWNSTTATSSVFGIGTAIELNNSAITYVAYLFATCPGVSKVGSYTGTGTTLSVDCGFTAGSRFVMIKRTDSTGDWYVWDTARGIIGGNDPYLLLNSTAVDVANTDYIDPLSSGFEISSTAPAAINANGGTYIFLAIA